MGSVDKSNSKGVDGYDDHFSLEEKLAAKSPSPTIENGDSETDDSMTRTADLSQLDQYGRYFVIRPHAKGGLGLVSVALDRELNREVALKEIRPDRQPRDEDVHRFLFEGELTGLLEHPGIVPVYGMGRSADGQPFYAMRLIKGETLRHEIRKFRQNQNSTPNEKRLWLKRIVTRFIQVCRTIEFAHQKGIIHRDLKPSNVMIGEHGETLVVDWGLAKRIDTEHDEPSDSSPSNRIKASHETVFGSIVGTPSYMSPEQANGDSNQVSITSDVFGLGATLFAICTGSSPYDCYGEEERDEAIRNASVQKISEVAPWIPKPLQAICHKSLAFDRKQRYESAVELANECELWLAGEPVAAYRENLFERSLRYARNNLTLVISGLVLLCMATFGSVIANGILTAKNRAIHAAEQEAKGNLALADEANSKLQDANSQLNQQNELLSEAKRKTDESLELALRTVVQLLDIVGRKELLKQKNSDVAELLADVSLVTRELNKRSPDDLEITLSAARVEHYAGNLDRWEGKFEDSMSHYQKSNELFKQLQEQKELSNRELKHLAAFLVDFGEFLKSRGKLGEAKNVLQRAFSITGSSEDGAVEFAGLRAQIHTSLPGIAEHMLDFELARELYQDAIAYFSREVENENTSLLNHIYLLANHAYLVDVLRNLREEEKAIEVGRKAEELLSKPSYSDSPTASVSTQQFSPTLYSNEARTFIALQDFEQALSLAKKATEEATSAYEATKQNQAYLPLIAKGLLLQSIAEANLGLPNDAIASIDKAIEHLSRFIDSPSFMSSYAMASEIYLQKYRLLESGEEKLECRSKSLEYIDQAIKRTPESEKYRKQKTEIETQLLR